MPLFIVHIPVEDAGGYAACDRILIQAKFASSSTCEGQHVSGLVCLIAAQHEHWFHPNRPKWLRFKPALTANNADDGSSRLAAAPVDPEGVHQRYWWRQHLCYEDPVMHAEYERLWLQGLQKSDQAAFCRADALLRSWAAAHGLAGPGAGAILEAAERDHDN